MTTEASKINTDMALKLFRSIKPGSVSLFTLLEFLDKPTHIGCRIGRDAPYTDAAVAFLREWADALEEAGKGGR